MATECLLPRLIVPNMRCSKCGFDNRQGRKFCAECGAPFTSRCAKCGAVNEPNEKFCGECGASLTLSAQLATGQPLQAPLVGPSIRVTSELAEAEAKVFGFDGERKTVTALFADIKGSMELMENLDPEEARAIVDPALKLMFDVVHRYDGYIVQSTGDGIFALFGAPAAHEDHPQRAVYAALRLQEEIHRYSAKLREAGNLPIEARVGINTGEVVVRSLATGEGNIEYTSIGHSTSLASRMQALAPTGSIATTDATRKLCEGYFNFRALGPTRVRGVSEPLDVFEVTGLGPLRTHFQVSARRGLTRFVGRQRELQALEHAYELAKGGRGQIVAAVAEPGVGKSRLFFEFKLLLQSDSMVLETFSVSHGKASAYLPVIDLLHGYFGIEPDDTTRKRREKVAGKITMLDRPLGDSLPYVFNLLGIVEGDDELAQMDGQVKKRRTLDSIKRILLRESLDQHLVVIFEDLHWIDEQTQEFLDLLADSIGTARILLLVNYRPEYSHQWNSKTYYSQLRLDALMHESAEEMLDALLTSSVPVVPATTSSSENWGADGQAGDRVREGDLITLKRLIIAKAEGTPFFMEEIIHGLFEQGALVRNGVTKLARPLTQIVIPTTVQAVLASRIDRLPAKEKQLLQILAVLGREFEWRLVQKMTNQPDSELESMVADLQGGEFIYEQPTAGDIRYTFKHALTQEVAYNSLLNERRKQLHEQAGQALEGILGVQLDDHLNQLAHHYSHSGNTLKAVEYLRLAGRQAVQRSANTEAITHLNAALALLSNLPATIETTRQELDLQIVLGVASLITRGWAAPEVETAYARARQICEQLGDDHQLTTIVYGLWQNATTAGELSAAFELAEELMTIAERRKDPTFLLVANFAVGMIAYYQGHFAQARDHADTGLSLYNRDVHRPLAFIYGQDLADSCQVVAGWSLWSLGFPEQALKRSQKALDGAQQSFHAFSSAVALVLAAIINHFCRDVGATEEYGRKLTLLCEQHGILFFQAWGMMFQGWAAAEQGRIEDGLRLMRDGLIAARRTGAKIWETLWLALQVQACNAIGQFDEAFSLLSEALTQVERRGECFYEAELYRLKGQLILRRTDPLGTPSPTDEAELQFQHAIAIARQQQGKSLELRATVSLARLLRDTGRREEARMMLGEIYNWFTEGFDSADLKEAKTLLDELCAG